MLVWRRDAASGETYALKLTAVGLKAATAMIEAADVEWASSSSPVVRQAAMAVQRAASVDGETTPALGNARAEVTFTRIDWTAQLQALGFPK